MKEQKGITIVAMIITIIVMVILVGVAITTAVLDGGVLQQAENAKTEYEAGEELEKVKLVAAEAYLAGSGVEITESNLIKALDENIGSEKYSLDKSNSEYFKVTITESERAYKVFKNGKIEGPLKETGGDDITPPGEGEENLPPQTAMPVATVGIKVEENSTINGEAYSSTNPIIPAGFTAINVTIEGQESSWDAEGGPEVDKGLVIRDENNNEFVWVPVLEDISTTQYVSEQYYREPDVITGNTKDSLLENLQRAGCIEDPNDGNTELTEDDFKVELTNMYKSMAESINKYDGFYVGRFETSKNGSNPQSKRSPGTVYDENFIVTAYNSITENDWYGLYALNKKYTTTSVQGSMMWGIQYDKMMSWMGAEANITISGYNKDRTCGTAVDDVINNVYDLYGNSHEWTLEVGWDEGDRRVTRGGYYKNGAYSYEITHSPNGRSVYDPTIYSTMGPVGSRLALYIK